MKKPLKPLLWVLILAMSVLLVTVFSSDSCTATKGKIAFASDRDGNAEIYIMNVDGSEQRRLTDNHAEDWDPSFSPDGSKIAFESDRDGNSEIYIMNVGGSEQTRLTNNPAIDWLPCFSP